MNVQTNDIRELTDDEVGAVTGGNVAAAIVVGLEPMRSMTGLRPPAT